MTRRATQHTADRHAAHELDWTRRADVDLPAGLELEWLGTSGFRIGYGGAALVVDPYLTRIPVSDVLRRRPARPSRELALRHVRSADAILVGHTHFDHALDTPLLTHELGCRAYGSRSLARLMRCRGVGDRAIEVEPYRVYEVGPFSFSFVPSVHSRLVLGWSVPYDGEISCEHFDDLAPSEYGCGQVWGIHIEVAGVSFYHQGSADLIDDAIGHRPVDYFLCGIAGRRFTDRYLERVLGRIEPRVVVPHHYDDFFRPLDAPFELSLNVDLAGFVDEVRAVSRDFEVRTLAPLSRVTG